MDLIWSAMAVAAIENYAAARKSRLAADQRALRAIYGIPKIEPEPTLCACCGSHQFRRHRGRWICIFCRVVGRS